MSIVPEKVSFEGYAGKYPYRVLGYFMPRKGDFYLSGAIVQAWRAPNDLGTKFIVVQSNVEHMTPVDGVQ